MLGADIRTRPRGLAESSPLGFYALATIAMWMFALGPTARLLGYRVLYKAPYAWLMVLPGFRDEFRAPARFAMLAGLTLSAAAAVAFWRLTAPRTARVRVLATCAAATAVMLDGWIAPLPIVRPPPALEVPAAVSASAAILKLPLGTFEDRSPCTSRLAINSTPSMAEPVRCTPLRHPPGGARRPPLRGTAWAGWPRRYRGVRPARPPGRALLPLVLTRAGRGWWPGPTPTTC